jgi:hypothetical protein
MGVDAMIEPTKTTIEKLLSPRTLSDFIYYSVACIFINVFSNQIKLNAIQSGALYIVLFAVLFFIERNRTRKLAAKLAFLPAKKKPEPAKGLILLLSPYNPFLKQLPDNFNEKIKRIIDVNVINLNENDFSEINLLYSNLRPQINALDYHIKADTLRELWLITTESMPATEKMKAVKGSEDTGRLLEKYIKFKYPSYSLEIHREGYTVKDYDYVGLWRKVESIFKKSSFKDEVIIGDITGGNKIMSVALAMACIPPKRLMQYMASDRDWQGNPVPEGEIVPVVINVDPILHPEAN